MGNQGSTMGHHKTPGVAPAHHPQTAARRRPRRHSDSVTDKLTESGTSRTPPVPSVSLNIARRLSVDPGCSNFSHQGTPPTYISVRAGRSPMEKVTLNTRTRKVSLGSEGMSPVPELSPPFPSPIVPWSERLPSPPASSEDDTPSPTRPRSRTLSLSTENELKWEKSKLVPTVFKFSRSPRAECVYLAGTMTGWRCQMMSKPAGESHWVRILEVEEGTHHYKFLVDGHWCTEESEPTVANDLGNLWNVVQVCKSDFEVFEALACDSFTLKDSEQKREERRVKSDAWTQVSPDFRSPEVRQLSPPSLPPHLLQVMLNRDVSYQPDPTLLEEPSHVMLNHFYAQAIKDSLLVLSSTQRYRKKYVTTILYKPIS